MRHASHAQTPTVFEAERIPPETDAPSGLPPGQEDEITPMGVPPDADPDSAGESEELPGFPEGDEGDTAG